MLNLVSLFPDLEVVKIYTVFKDNIRWYVTIIKCDTKISKWVTQTPWDYQIRIEGDICFDSLDKRIYAYDEDEEEYTTW